MAPVAIAIANAVFPSLFLAGIANAAGVALAIGWIGATALAVGGTFALQAAAAALAPKPGRVEGPRPEDVQSTVRQATAPRARHYGLVKVAGPLAFFEAKEGKQHACVLLSQGEITSFEEHWLGDDLVTLDGSNFVNEEKYTHAGSKRVKINTTVGTDDQTAFADLVAAFPGDYTTDHRLRGIAAVHLSFQDVPADAFRAMYPQGAPAYRGVIKAAKILDVRTGVTAWSDNAALVILDYCTHVDAMARPRELFDEDSFAAAADICDELVSLKEGGTEKRYRLSNTYRLNEPHADVLRRFLATCEGDLYLTPEGKFGLRVGVWEEPTVTIEDEHILSYQMERGVDALAAFNKLKLKYVSPQHDFQEQEAEAWENEDLILSTGEEKVEELSLLAVPSPSQARRLGKIASAKQNPEWRGVVVTTFGGGMRAFGDRNVTLKLSELEIEQTFRVLDFKMSSDLTQCQLAVVSLSSSAYAWNALLEEGTPPAIPPDLPEATGVAEPEGFDAIAGLRPVEGGGSLVMAVTSWDEPSRDSISHEIEFRRIGETSWTRLSIPAGTNTREVGPLASGDDYELRIRALSVTGVPSDWTDPIDMEATADGTPPAAPTGFSTTLLTNDVTINWTNPASTNFYVTRVYRSITNVFGDAVEIAALFGDRGEAKQCIDSDLAVDQYWYWIESFNASLVGSGEVGPETETVV